MSKPVFLILSLILSLIFFCRSFAGEQISLTVEEALALALRDNRDVRLKAEDVFKAKLKVKEAKAGFLPTLNFTGSRTNTRDYYPKDISQSTTQTTLKQYLYKGGKTVNTLKYNEYSTAVSNAILDKTKLDIALNVKKTFYTLLLAKDFADLNEEILQNAQEHLTALKIRLRNGQASSSDILVIENSLSNVQEAYALSLNQLTESTNILRNLLYLDKDADIIANGELIYEPKDMVFDTAFIKAMQQRPEIKQYEAQAKANSRSIELAKADNRPNIYASWDYYSRSTTSLTFSPTKSWQDYSVIGLTFSWPIFDGWATKSKVEQAVVDLKATQLSKEKAAGDIKLEISNAYLGLGNAINKIKTSDAQIALYNDNFSQAKERYGKGMVSLLDLKDAGLKYKIAVFNKSEAIYDYAIAKAAFERASGEI